MNGYEVQAQRLRGMHYVSDDYGQLCLTCATDYDLVGPVEFARSGSCYNCGPDDLESQRRPVMPPRRARARRSYAPPMEGYSAAASDLFKIAVNVAGHDSSELTREIFSHRHGDKITVANVTAALHRIVQRTES